MKELSMIFFVGFLSQNIILVQSAVPTSLLGFSMAKKDIMEHLFLFILLSLCVSIFLWGVQKVINIYPTGFLTFFTVLIVIIFSRLIRFLLKNKIHTIPSLCANCAFLGVILSTFGVKAGFTEILFYSLGSSLGYGFVLVISKLVYDRMELSYISNYWRGQPIVLATIGILSIAVISLARGLGF